MMKKASGLGRGLGALLGDSAMDENSGGVTTLPITEVENNSSQPRKSFDPAALEDLAESIRQHGLIQPLAVRKLPSGYYQIIAGERRWRAARMAGLGEVPVVILDVDDRTAAELALVENLQREDLNPIEEAAGYRTLMEQYQMTQEDVAASVGKSRSAVANALRLLDLSDDLRVFLEDGRLSAGHARTLLSLPDALRQRAADTIMSGGLSVRQAEALAKRLSPGKAKPKEKKTEDHTDGVNYTEEAQRDLSGKLGRGVRIISGRKKGRIELDFYGLDDLNDLIDALSLLELGTVREGASE